MKVSFGLDLPLDCLLTLANGVTFPLDFGEVLALGFFGDYLKRLMVRDLREHMLLVGVFIV